MKRSIVFSIILCMAFNMQAQLKAGIRAGLSSTDIMPGDLVITNQDGLDEFKFNVSNATYGLHFGAFAQAKIGGFFIQPEVLFNSNTVDFTVEDLGSLSNTAFQEKYQYLDIPVMMGLKFGPLRLQAGPVAHVFISSKSDLVPVDGYEQNFESTSFGYQAGIGLDLWKFIIDIKYEGNFSKFGNHITIDGQPYAFDKNPSRMVATLGISF